MGFQRPGHGRLDLTTGSERGGDAPFAGPTVTVRPEWIDDNGHMNLAYYVVVFDMATDALFDTLMLGAADNRRRGCGTFAVETHTLYEQELRLGEAVRLVSHVLAADAKRLHLAHEMFHVASGRRAAMQELLFLHVDRTSRRAAPFPEDVRALLTRTVAAHGRVARPHGLGRRVGMPAGASATAPGVT